MEVKNLDRFRGKIKWTKITGDGDIIISIPPKTHKGYIKYDSCDGFYARFPDDENDLPFKLAGVEKRSFMQNVLGYVDGKEGTWPWMKSIDDVVKVLVELDKLYVSKEPEMSKSEPTDFIPKKKHYSFNFAI